MTRHIKLSIALCVAALWVAPFAAIAVAQDSAMTPVEALSQPVTDAELATAPAATPEPVAEAEQGIVADVAAALQRGLGDLLYYLVGAAGAWAMGMLGFKEWNSAKVQEALHNEKMKPYADGVIQFAVGWLAQTLTRKPKVLELLAWITEQFPEVRNWIGRTDKERIGYLQTFIDAPGPASADTVKIANLFAPGNPPVAKKRVQTRVKPQAKPVGGSMGASPAPSAA